MFSLIKSKLAAFGLALMGIMAIAIAVLKAQVSNEKRKSAEQELEDEKAARELSNAATEALVKGVTDENTTTDRRSYKFD